MGGSGEVFLGTTIKDLWTKPRGVQAREGSGDGWGGRSSEGVVKYRQL